METTTEIDFTADQAKKACLRSAETYVTIITAHIVAASMMGDYCLYIEPEKGNLPEQDPLANRESPIIEKKLNNFFVIRSESSRTVCQLLDNKEYDGTFWNGLYGDKSDFSIRWNMDANYFINKMKEKGYEAYINEPDELMAGWMSIHWE